MISVFRTIAIAVTVCACISTAIAHPVNIYSATLEITEDHAVLDLEVDQHGMEHERLLFADDPSEEEIRANLAKSIRIRDEHDDLLRPDTIEVEGDHTIVTYTLTDPGPCSIAQEPLGALAIGRRVIALTLVRPGTETPARTVELSSGANPEIISLSANPITDPERFTRPRIRVMSNTELRIDFPRRILPREAKPNLSDFADWVRASLPGTEISHIITSSISTDDTAIEEQDLDAHNPSMIRARAIVHFDHPITSFTWTGYSASLRACDVLDAQGTRFAILNPSANTSDLAPPKDD